MSTAAITSDPTPTPANPTRLLRKPVILQRIGFSDTTLWRLVKTGRFPAAIRISTNAVAWREADVEAWIRQRAELSPR